MFDDREEFLLWEDSPNHIVAKESSAAQFVSAAKTSQIDCSVLFANEEEKRVSNGASGDRVSAVSALVRKFGEVGNWDDLL